LLLWLPEQLLLRALRQARLCVRLRQLLAQARHLPLQHLNVLHSFQSLQSIFFVPPQHITL
jgi:hypothetical protein